MSKPSLQDPTKICVALDFSDETKVLTFVDSLSDKNLVLKVGLELFTLSGPELVRKMVKKGFEVFLDLKLHDIPNTVEKSAQKIADLGVQYFTLHLAGGERMIEMTRNGLEKYGANKPKILGVSVLTSFSEGSWRDTVGAVSMGAKSVSSSVLGLVDLGVRAKVDGVVCSPLELTLIRQSHPSLLTVTPGIRPTGSDANDQSRVMTPGEAKRAGANILVIGRPITEVKDPNVVIQNIRAELK
ncbi:MAG: orotidine-5'-phosphate decarboxylase [Xanthomonadaceae bacterium]|nr:orotidine-5'-phosphate decarboxylase [Xanthomonadaceae bacterium]